MPRRPRSRVRRAADWAALSASVAITLVYFGTWSKGVWWSCPWGRLLYVGAERGAAAIIWHNDQTGMRRDLVATRVWMLELSEGPVGWATWLPMFHQHGPPPACVAAWIPLWPVVMIVAVPTSWLWRRERGAAGCCPDCGYDLAGLAAGAACPECGKSHRPD